MRALAVILAVYLARTVACVDAELVRRRAAPATENTADEPDPQRLALGRLQCSCHLVKNSIKAVPMSFLTTLVQGRARSKDASARSVEGAIAEGQSKRPDRLECSCSTKVSGAKLRLPQKKTKLEGSGGDMKPAAELTLPEAS